MMRRMDTYVIHYRSGEREELAQAEMLEDEDDYIFVFECRRVPKSDVERIEEESPIPATDDGCDVETAQEAA
jgi:hypothetical protein